MAGEAAQQEFERRRARRQARMRDPRVRALAIGIVVLSFGLGAIVPVLPLLMAGSEVRFGMPSLLLGAILAAGAAVRALAPPQSETAWRRGAEGERVVARALDRLKDDGGRVLHDRRMPNSKANIDHLVVTSAGVFTVDAKRYTGKLETRGRGRELWVAGRNRSKLLEQAQRQAAAVAAVLRDEGLGAVPVHPVLCFVDTQMPWLFAPKAIGDVLITTPRTVRKRLGDEDRLSKDLVSRAAELLDRRFPPAGSSVARRPAPRSADRGRPAATRPSTPTPSGAAPPVCRCGAPMVRRARRSDGAAFYGCSTFPRCRQTRPIEG